MCFGVKYISSIYFIYLQKKKDDNLISFFQVDYFYLFNVLFGYIMPYRNQDFQGLFQK